MQPYDFLPWHFKFRLENGVCLVGDGEYLKLSLMVIREYQLYLYVH